MRKLIIIALFALGGCTQLQAQSDLMACSAAVADPMVNPFMVPACLNLGADIINKLMGNK